MFLDKFLRDPSSGNYIREIDGLRFFAIFPVVILHLNTSYYRTFDSKIFQEFYNAVLIYGGWGVELFFAISGFVITLPFFIKIKAKNYDLVTRSFFIKRFKRIEPPFVISLCLIYLLSLLSGRLDFADSVDNFFASLLYLHKLIYSEWSIVNPVTWSLETEIQFYILIPIVFAILVRFKTLYVFFIACVLFIASIFAHEFGFLSARLNLSVFNFAHLFIIGICISYIYVFKNHLLSRSYFFDVLFLFSLLIIYLAKSMNSIFLFDSAVFLLFFSVFKLKFLERFLCSNVLVIIGGMCYSIYLLHYSVVHAVHVVFNSLQFDNYVIVNSLSLIVTLLISSIFYLYVEKPFMNSDKTKRANGS